MESRNDREFAEIIATIANLRRSDRSVSIVVSSLFQPMVDHLSLAEFKNYILSRYSSRRGEGRNGKYDIVDLNERELKSFDRAFLYKDFLRITFSYGDSWETVDRFLAILLNDQL